MVVDMKGTYEHLDTWTHISVAAERVLTQIEETKEKRAREHQETDREKCEANHDAERAQCSAVMIENRKLVR